MRNEAKAKASSLRHRATDPHKLGSVGSRGGSRREVLRVEHGHPSPQDASGDGGPQPRALWSGDMQEAQCFPHGWGLQAMHCWVA